MTCSYQSALTSSVSTRTVTIQGIGFLETLKNLANLFKNNLNNNNARNNMKSQVKKKEKNGGIVELLIPTLNKIIKKQDTYFVVIMSNRLKIISDSVNGAPLQSMGGFFPSKSLS